MKGKNKMKNKQKPYSQKEQSPNKGVILAAIISSLGIICAAVVTAFFAYRTGTANWEQKAGENGWIRRDSWKQVARENGWILGDNWKQFAAENGWIPGSSWKQFAAENGWIPGESWKTFAAENGWVPKSECSRKSVTKSGSALNGNL